MNESNPYESPAMDLEAPGHSARGNSPGKLNLRRLAILKLLIALAFLVVGFTFFTPVPPARALAFLTIGAAAFAALASWPRKYHPLEAWMCLIIILSFGSFGAIRFLNDRQRMHPWDHDDFFRLYVGWAIIAGVAVTTPYILLRLAILRNRPQGG